MTETSKKILESYQIRKTKKQKTAFIEYMETVARDMEYPFKAECGKSGDRNIVIGNPKNAKVIFTAHYDTPPVMPLPNFITPKNILIYVLYQIFMTAVLMILPAVAIGIGAYFLMTALSLGGDAAREIAWFLGYVVVFLASLLILFGPANKHNANDNTSGVTTIVDIMRDLPPELRDGTAFVLFDLEERGLIGSACFYKQNKDFMKDKLLINFDCVGEGEHFLFTLRKKAKDYDSLISDAYRPTDKFSTEVISKGFVYPSDQANFPCGVGVCSLNRSNHGILYMNKIHTSRDIVYKEENIEYLKDSSIRLVKILSEKI